MESNVLVILPGLITTRSSYVYPISRFICAYVEAQVLPVIAGLS